MQILNKQEDLTKYSFDKLQRGAYVAGLKTIFLSSRDLDPVQQLWQLLSHYYNLSSVFINNYIVCGNNTYSLLKYWDSIEKHKEQCKNHPSPPLQEIAIIDILVNIQISYFICYTMYVIHSQPCV